MIGGLSKISAYSVTDKGCLGLEPGAAMHAALDFKTHKGAEGQANVIALRTTRAMLSAFHATELL